MLIFTIWFSNNLLNVMWDIYYQQTRQCYRLNMEDDVCRWALLRKIIALSTSDAMSEMLSSRRMRPREYYKHSSLFCFVFIYKDDDDVF